MLKENKNTVGDSIEFMLKHSNEARWDIIARALSILEHEFIKRPSTIDLIYDIPKFETNYEVKYPLDFKPVGVPIYEIKVKCTCPHENFIWNGKGCECGGI